MTLIRTLQLYIPNRKFKKPSLNTNQVDANQVDVTREHAMPLGVRIGQNIGRRIFKNARLQTMCNVLKYLEVL